MCVCVVCMCACVWVCVCVCVCATGHFISEFALNYVNTATCACTSIYKQIYGILNSNSVCRLTAVSIRCDQLRPTF